MIVDEAQLHIKAGHGGPGKVCFSTIPRNSGPTGGNGGVGGSVYIEGVSDLSALRQYRFKKDFFAQDGVRGGEANRAGANGEDLILKVPVGTLVHDKTTKKEFEVTRVGERVMIAKGGKGGKGNFAFRSSRNPSPLIAQPGLPGEEFEAFFELQLIADVGLIGLPNAGKSSLLNELTKAGARVANYPFTTLEPNLGVYYPAAVLKASDEEQQKATPVILADIPGLIEGASTGKGLGFKFLRHIQRTNILLHCVAADSAAVNDDYKAIRAELTKYDKASGNPAKSLRDRGASKGGSLSLKQEYILLTKSDTVDAATLKKQMAALKRFSAGGGSSSGEKKPVLIVSIHSAEQMEQVKQLLDDIVRK